MVVLILSQILQGLKPYYLYQKASPFRPILGRATSARPASITMSSFHLHRGFPRVWSLLVSCSTPNLYFRTIFRVSAFGIQMGRWVVLKPTWRSIQRWTVFHLTRALCPGASRGKGETLSNYPWASDCPGPQGPVSGSCRHFIIHSLRKIAMSLWQVLGSWRDSALWKLPVKVNTLNHPPCPSQNWRFKTFTLPQ